MTRRDDQRLEDILASVRAIQAHLERGGLDDGLVFDRLVKRSELSTRNSWARAVDSVG